MTQIFINLALFLLALTFVLAMFLGLVWFGFRMGRQSIDKPLAPIIKDKAVPLSDEDPYFEAMNGHEQPSVPTAGR